ncbi:keratin-associated protein 20-2-like [Desmodus rotundus]|uniref:keratin-associated protein 20-2-like n=1 Tax=Desmodus rotundus TaxID=9430 RepID=UPI000D17FB3F|nr:keratin-associated protein 20-2-like [Desmodus rotundus]
MSFYNYYGGLGYGYGGLGCGYGGLGCGYGCGYGGYGCGYGCGCRYACYRPCCYGRYWTSAFF